MKNGKTYSNKKKCLYRHIFKMDAGRLLLLHLPKKRARLKFIKNYMSGMDLHIKE